SRRGFVNFKNRVQTGVLTYGCLYPFVTGMLTKTLRKDVFHLGPGILIVLCTRKRLWVKVHDREKISIKVCFQGTHRDPLVICGFVYIVERRTAVNEVRATLS